jgi:uncharacterized membrane protein
MVETKLYYTNNKLSKIEDDLGRVCTIDYTIIDSTTFTINISKPDLTSIVIVFENNLVKTINGILDNSDNNGFFADFGKYIIILAVVIAVGVIITIVETKKKKRRRRNRSRKYL